MAGPVLVVLAAGMGSRYGGLKQMDRIGKNGEVLLDYSVFDALRSGFEKAVFIIRHDIEKDFRELVLARMKGVSCDLAFQDLDTLIPSGVFAEAKKAGRTKPWGTTHALLCAAEKIDGPFTVLNADDFYGLEAYRAMGVYLKSESSKTEGAIVPYELQKTLSPQGTVTRGVCEIKDGYLASVDELTAIEKKDGSIFNTGPGGVRRDLAGNTPVSMNFWGFPQSIFPHLQKYFDNFLAGFAGDMEGNIKSECYLPKAADWLIKEKIIRIRALRADSDWFGVTYKEDREAAVRRIETLTAGGIYPPGLW
jgi:NDP-sugar pyrophosphorylase family protein